MKLNNDNLIAAIYNELARASDYSNAALSDVRANAWAYYLNKNRGDEMPGRSTVQDTTVRDVTHSLMAAIMPAYSSDHLISFEPVGPGDEDRAEAESAAINRLFTEDNQGYQQLSSAVSDALLFRNGVIKVWLEEKETVTTRSFAAPAAEVLAQVPDGEEWEYQGAEDGLSRFKVKRTEQKLRTESIEPAYLLIDPNQSDQQLYDSSFIAELAFFTRSDLVGLGVTKKLAYDLPAIEDIAVSGEGAASTVDLMAKFIDGNTDVGRAATTDRELVECHWVHMQVDRDGDGISEKWRFLVSNRSILLDEMVEFFPYASGSGWPVPHRWSGLGVYDLCRITQDEMTNARRQLADNLNVANNQRPIFDPGETEAADIVNGAPGRGIRSKNPANVAFMPIQDVVSNSVAFLQYMGSVRSDQAGATLDMQGADGQLMQSVSGISAEMQLAPRELMAAHIARNLAETLVRNVFLLIHRTLRGEWSGTLMYNRSGDWQETNPAEWQPRSRINVNVGLSPGERRRKSAALQQILQVQMSMIQGGTANITTTWNGVHAALVDWMQSVELDGYEGYFLDPDGQQSQAGQQAAGQSQQQQQQMNAQMTAMQVQIEQAKVQIDRQKVENDRLAKEKELAWKYFDSLLDADMQGEQLDAKEIERSASAGAATASRGNGSDRADAA